MKTSKMENVFESLFFVLWVIFLLLLFYLIFLYWRFQFPIVLPAAEVIGAVLLLFTLFRWVKRARSKS